MMSEYMNVEIYNVESINNGTLRMRFYFDQFIHRLFHEKKIFLKLFDVSNIKTIFMRHLKELIYRF